jgi:hypothetical protein
MAAIEKRLRPLVTRINDLKIPSPEGNYQELDALIDAESHSVLQEVLRELRDNVGLRLGALEAKLSSPAGWQKLWIKTLTKLLME